MKRTVMASCVLLVACSRPSESPQANRAAAPMPVAVKDAGQQANPAEEKVVANEPKTLAEPKGPIDPKSVEAAGQVVQHYGALIEQKRFVEAEKLWGNAEAAADFSKQLRPGTHLEIGELGDTEGAAGSIYTTMPVVFYGDDFRRPATITLRRVNDVPGSTEAQRRWHIERIDWGTAP